jgi:hypothetical protein
LKGTGCALHLFSVGKLSIVEAADLLELPDAGFVLHLLAENGLPLPKLREADVRKQADNSLEAMRSCLPLPHQRGGPGSYQVGEPGARGNRGLPA